MRLLNGGFGPLQPGHEIAKVLPRRFRDRWVRHREEHVLADCLAACASAVPQTSQRRSGTNATSGRSQWGLSENGHHVACDTVS
jgi:hypothetical protein